VAALPPNDTIETEWVDGTVRLTGIASAEWVASAIQNTASLSTDAVRLNFDGVEAPAEPKATPSPPPPTPPPIDLQAVIKQSGLEQSYLLFQSGTDELSAGNEVKLPALADAMKKVIAAANQVGQDVTITLAGIGQTHGVHDDYANSLGKKRAMSVWRRLQKSNVPAGNVLLQGISNDHSLKLPAGFSREMAADCCLVRIAVTPTQKKP